MSIRLLIYNNNDWLWRYKWRLWNTEISENTSFKRAITIAGCRRAAHKQNHRVDAKVKKDTGMPIKNEWIGVS